MMYSPSIANIAGARFPNLFLFSVLNRCGIRFLICRYSFRSKRSIAAIRCSVNVATVQLPNCPDMWHNQISGLVLMLLWPTGAICNAARRVSDACLPVVGAIKQYVASALTLNIDERAKIRTKRLLDNWQHLLPSSDMMVLNLPITSPSVPSGLLCNGAKSVLARSLKLANILPNVY